MKVKDKKIGFCITGSFCTLNATMPLMEALVSQGAEVVPIITESVLWFDTKFGKAKDWSNRITEITGKKPLTTIVGVEPIGPNNDLDLLVVVPCTGNTLGKLSGGITDNAVTMAVKAHMRNLKPIVIGVSTNDGLSGSIKNIADLITRKNVYFIPFYQDAPKAKPNSLMFQPELFLPTIELSLEGRQIEPVLWQR